MRLLILSCNTGEGHNSCAKAVSEYTLQQGDSCEVVDSLSFISERTSRFISNGHSRIYRYAPSAFSHGYSFAERHGNFFAEDSSVYKLLTSGTEELYAFQRKTDYDAILCTHVFSALQLTHLLRYHSLKATTFFRKRIIPAVPAAVRAGWVSISFRTLLLQMNLSPAVSLWIN